MQKSVDIVLRKCLGIKKSERLLIVTDSRLYDLSKLFFIRAEKITPYVKLIKIPISKINGTEPPKEVAEEMKKYDVEILITTMSLSHTNARISASKAGARIVTMPGINKGMINRAINIDYNKLKIKNSKIAKIINKGKKVRIQTKVGTDISFSVTGRKADGTDSGIFTKKGSFGNLPSGEVFVAPFEGTAEGVYVVDASFAGIGKLKTSLKIFVRGGFAFEIEGYNSNKLVKMLDSVGKFGRNIAEFGIGTNEKAKITGKILEDEKVMGTCHIALGNNSGFGGNVNVPLHLDGIIKSPSIWIDSKKIMDNGKFKV